MELTLGITILVLITTLHLGQGTAVVCITHLIGYPNYGKINLQNGSAYSCYGVQSFLHIRLTPHVSFR